MKQLAYDLILFDLGGVLIDISGSQDMLRWLGSEVSEEAFWRQWLVSPAVRAYESGRLDRQAFARGVIEEFGLRVDGSEFLASFYRWIRAPYAGAHELLFGLAGSYRLGCLSNTNEFHWPRISEEMGLMRHFHYPFLSFQVGMMKPDAELFEHVLGETGLAPQRVLFLDDNAINVASARRHGIDAHQVCGVDEVAARLKALGVLTSWPVVASTTPR